MSGLVHVRCYHCGHDNYLKYDSENGFNLVKCQECGLLYVNPRPGDQDIDQASMTGIHRGDQQLKVKTRYDRKKIKKYLRVMGDFFAEGELADDSLCWHDIGCGMGEFLIALREFSGGKLKLSGNDPNARKSDFARQQGLDVTEELPDPARSRYHFISLLNVFSHLPDPVLTLSAWKELLYPGGELFIETGHSCHLPRKYHHRPYYLPDHLSFANEEILISILERIGFKVIKVKRYRAEMYPEDLTGYLKYLAMNIYRGNLNWQTVIPKEPDRDLFIRAILL